MGETFVAFQDVWGKRLERPSLIIKTTSADFKNRVGDGREGVCLFPAAIRSSAFG